MTSRFRGGRVAALLTLLCVFGVFGCGDSKGGNSGTEAKVQTESAAQAESQVRDATNAYLKALGERNWAKICRLSATPPAHCGPPEAKYPAGLTASERASLRRQQQRALHDMGASQIASVTINGESARVRTVAAHGESYTLNWVKRGSEWKRTPSPTGPGASTASNQSAERVDKYMKCVADADGNMDKLKGCAAALDQK